MSNPLSLAKQGPRIPWGPLATVIIVAILAGLSIAISGGSPLAVPVAVALGLIVVTATNPMAGVAVWLLVGPLIVGLARGELIPFLRPNEVLLVVILIGVAINAVWRSAAGERIFPRPHPLDVGVGMLALTGSLLPLLIMIARGNTPTTDDLLYAMVFVKYLLLYLLFRITVRTEIDVRLCIKLIVASGAIVATVAVLQVNAVFGVPGILFEYYDSPFEGFQGQLTDRGTSTIASSFGLADVMAMCLAIVMAWFARRPRWWLAGAAALFLAGALAAGSFSGFIAVAVAALVAAVLSGQLRLLIGVSIPAVALAAAAFWQVIAARLAGFESLNGLPRSWVGRLENLERFVWPELFSGNNWLFGVRPAARIRAPESWRDWVYIESGHTWLLWTGGVALLLAFLAFFWITVRTLVRIASSTVGDVGIAATAAAAGSFMIFVLMLFDPHLTVRGTADLFFPLLALSVVGSQRGRLSIKKR